MDRRKLVDDFAKRSQRSGLDSNAILRNEANSEVDIVLQNEANRM
jgi:hypothetical protein